jgi:mono/diheme cytochrome c family protein
MSSGATSSGGTSASGGTASGGGGSAGLDLSSGSGGDGATGAAGAPEPGFMLVFTETASCATCHGDTGEGVATYGPDIRHPSRDLYLYMVRNGEAHQLALFRKPMDPVDTTLASDADLDAIFDWLSAMPKPTTGAELFADYCGYCHGADGRGGDKTIAYASAYHSAPYRRSGQDFLDYVRAGHVVDDQGAPVAVADRHAYMPPFPAEMLTDQEIQLIEAWVPKQ